MLLKKLIVLLLAFSAFSSFAEASFNIEIESGQHQVLVENVHGEPVIVTVTDSQNNPVADEQLNLLIVAHPSSASDWKLQEQSVITNPLGQASVIIPAPPKEGEYRILVTVAQDPSVYEFIHFNVNHESWIMYLTFGVLGGLGMFLYGMKLGAGGLQKMAGKKMKSILGAFTNNRYLGVVTGIIATTITQSSSATTVMLVGFVNASLMNLAQALAVIMGANIGTTITVQLIAFNISDYALLMIGLGFIFRSWKNKNVSYCGDILMGFGFIFYGMAVMSMSMAPLRNYPAFKDLLLSFSDYPMTAIIGSMFFTALIQSSGATIGLVVAFAGQGLIDLSSAVPLILGAETGTCITGWLSAIGGSAGAKKTALLNILFNLLGTIIFIPFLYGRYLISDLIVWYTAIFQGTGAREVANAHMFCALLKVFFMWFFYYKIIDLANYLIPDESTDDLRSVKAKYLSETLLETPELALGNVAREIVRMAGHVEYMIEKVPQLVSYGDEVVIAEVSFREEKVDADQYQITRYLSLLSENSLTEEQTTTMVRYMHIINNLESQADLIHKIIIPFSRNKAKEDIRFSEEGFRELMAMFNKIHENFMLTINAFATYNLEQAQKIIDSEEEFETLVNEYRNSHMRRVFQQTVESIETSTKHMDLLGCFKRINMHSIDLAKAMKGDWHGIKKLISKELKNEQKITEEIIDQVLPDTAKKVDIENLSDIEDDEKNK